MTWLGIENASKTWGINPNLRIANAAAHGMRVNNETGTARLVVVSKRRLTTQKLKTNVRIPSTASARASGGTLPFVTHKAVAWIEAPTSHRTNAVTNPRKNGTF